MKEMYMEDINGFMKSQRSIARDSNDVFRINLIDMMGIIAKELRMIRQIFRLERETKNLKNYNEDLVKQQRLLRDFENFVEYEWKDEMNKVYE